MEKTLLSFDCNPKNSFGRTCHAVVTKSRFSNKNLNTTCATVRATRIILSIKSNLFYIIMQASYQQIKYYYIKLLWNDRAWTCPFWGRHALITVPYADSHECMPYFLIHICILSELCESQGWGGGEAISDKTVCGLFWAFQRLWIYCPHIVPRSFLWFFPLRYPERTPGQES